MPWSSQSAFSGSSVKSYVPVWIGVQAEVDELVVDVEVDVSLFSGSSESSEGIVGRPSGPMTNGTLTPGGGYGPFQGVGLAAAGVIPSGIPTSQGIQPKIVLPNKRDQAFTPWQPLSDESSLGGPLTTLCVLSLLGGKTVLVQVGAANVRGAVNVIGVSSGGWRLNARKYNGAQ